MRQERKILEMFNDESSLNKNIYRMMESEKMYSEKGRKEIQKDNANIIEDAFKPIQCTAPMMWKTHSKSLIDQIEEDHPSEKKSIEYNFERKNDQILPIGQGVIDKSMSRMMNLGKLTEIQREATEKDDTSEIKRMQYMEEMQNFAKKRGIVSGSAALVYSISKDQEGSRFIQKKLDGSTREEIEITFEEIRKWISELITDLFGNYVIQKFLEIGTVEQQEIIFSSMEGSVIQLALHMYGCRVIQKALECKTINKKIVEKIKGHVVELICDQNGNHVIQKCVECVNTDFVIKEFEQDAVGLSRHRYGCRVIQRIFENSSKCSKAIDQIILNARSLVEDQYGNYVIQHILEKGTDECKRKIIEDFTDKMVEYSTHKFASNVMEKCVVCGSPEARKKMLSKIMPTKAQDNTLIAIACDKFGNYVIQRLLDVLKGKEKESLVLYLKTHISELKKSSYAKCILAKLSTIDAA